MIKRACLICALVQLWSQPAPAADIGRIIFVRGGAIYEVSLTDRAASPILLQSLPTAREVQWIDATRDGSVVALDFGNTAAWIVNGELKESACTGRASLSATGQCVACPQGDTFAIYSVAGVETSRLPPRLREARFWGSSGALVALDEDGVVAYHLGKEPALERVLTRPGSQSYLRIAPDGGRGLAIFGDKAEARVYSFSLDGQGVPRRIGGEGVPLAWSWSSEWVLLQVGGLESEEGDDESEDVEGAILTADPWLLGAPRARKKRSRRPPPPPPKPPETRACVVRATGGETKCWDDFRALAFSPDSTHVLLKKGTSLYVSKIAGVRAEQPKEVLTNVDGPATWVP